jgi:hypothetical protein
MPKTPITVHKLNEQGVEVWQYKGTVVERTENSFTLHAHFDRDDIHFFGLKLERGDLFVETFYQDRWYNIFTIYDQEGKGHKGWYCNVTRPAIIGDGHIYAEDLALDLLIFPDGRQEVLDEAEFDALELSEDDHRSALDALDELQRLADRREGPFQIK